MRMACTLLLLSMMIGCTTVTPSKVKDEVPSFEGNEQNSGFIGFDAEGYGVITEKARERYNCLVALYGNYFIPEMKPDDGLQWTPAVAGSLAWKIDREHLVKFATMNRWYRENKPVKPVEKPAVKKTSRLRKALGRLAPGLPA